MGWRLYFLDSALEARDVEDFLSRTRPCLLEDESRGLRSALDHFRPGFDGFWQDGAYVRDFEERFREYLETGGLPEYLGEVARFFDVDPAGAPPPVLCFVLLPKDGPTHAQAVGTHLLVEVRPGDEFAPSGQVQVVAHETSHYLFELIPEDRIAALETRAAAAAAGGKGRRAWLLLHEALPTALGQGLAVARLTPGVFDWNSSWYHVPEIERYAKRLYPIVRREIDAGRTIEGPFFEEAIKAFDGEEDRSRSGRGPADAVRPRP
jgi:hypothetical protein